MVRDNNVDRWFFRHNALQAELGRRFLITERKLNQRYANRQKNWGHLNVRHDDYKTYGYTAAAGSDGPYGIGRGPWSCPAA